MKTIRKTLLLLPLSLALVLGAAALHAQAVQTGTLVGTVEDGDGEGLPGVQVEVRSPALQGTRETFSGGTVGAEQAMTIAEALRSHTFEAAYAIHREHELGSLEAGKRADAVVLGAVGGPKWSDPNAPVRPEQGLLKIRKELGLFANLRPVRLHPALLHPYGVVVPAWLEGESCEVAFHRPNLLLEGSAAPSARPRSHKRCRPRDRSAGTPRARRADSPHAAVV